MNRAQQFLHVFFWMGNMAASTQATRLQRTASHVRALCSTIKITCTRPLVWTALLVLTLMGHTPSPAAQLPPLARHAIHKAQVLLEKSDATEAAAILVAYLASTEETAPAEVYLVLGDAYHRQKHLEKAIQIFQKGFTAYPANEYLCRNLGVALYEAQRFAEAAGYFETQYALQKKPSAEVLHQAASLYYQAKQYKASATASERLLATHRPPRKDWIQLAVHAHLQAGQPAKAETLILQLLDASPDEAGYWKLLATIYLDRNENARAAAALEIHSRLTSTQRQEMEWLASLYTYLDAPLLAAHTLERAYGTTPPAAQVPKVAALYASAGRVDTALTYMRRYISGNTSALTQGKMLFNARRFSEAERVFSAITSGPDHDAASFFLALCAWERKDWDTVQAQLRRVTSRNTALQKQAAAYTSILQELESARASLPETRDTPQE